MENTELVKLRVSVARMAQTLGINHDAMNLAGLGFNDLKALAQTQERGWNELVAACMDEAAKPDERGIENKVTVTMGVSDLAVIVNALQNEQARCVVSNVLQKYAHRVNAVANHFSKLYDAELHAITCANIKAQQ